MTATPLSVDDAIRQRQTTKVLAAEELPTQELSALLDELVSVAGMAPFHRACDESHRGGKLTGIEPWRFYVVSSQDCRQLAKQIPLENAGKIPSMLRAASALIMSTWLPNPARLPNPTLDDGLNPPDVGFEPTLGNMEHIAAAAAAVQNLLIAATSRGIPNYWSSGGVLRSDEVYKLLEIPTKQILLGAVFLFPTVTSGADVVGSKLRDKRTPSNQWATKTQLS